MCTLRHFFKMVLSVYNKRKKKIATGFICYHLLNYIANYACKSEFCSYNRCIVENLFLYIFNFNT